MAAAAEQQRGRVLAGAGVAAGTPAGNLSMASMASMAEHSEELAELERRVEELENVIGAQKDGDSIGEAVRRIDAQLSAHTTTEQRKLFELYSSHKQLVEQPLRFAASDAELAVEHLDDISAMAKQLEELDQLKDQINPAYLSGVWQRARRYPASPTVWAAMTKPGVAVFRAARLHY